jgi:nucleotide-binding universal stress UspA family protein
LAAALTLADKLDSRIHLLHVVNAQAQPGLEELTRAAVQGTLEQAAQRMREAAQEVRRAGHLGEAITRVGHPSRVILLTAEELGADMIVLGASGRRGLGRLLLGSTTEEVVREAQCQVLVAKLPKPCARAQGLPLALALPGRPQPIAARPYS